MIPIHLWLGMQVLNNLIQLAIIKALSFRAIIFQKINQTITWIEMNNFAFNLILSPQLSQLLTG